MHVQPSEPSGQRALIQVKYYVRKNKYYDRNFWDYDRNSWDYDRNFWDYTCFSHSYAPLSDKRENFTSEPPQAF